MKYFGLVLLTLAAFAVSSCNTVSGFGKDMQNLGKSITGSAEE